MTHMASNTKKKLKAKSSQKTQFWRGIFSGLIGSIVLGLIFLMIGYGFNYQVVPAHSQEAQEPLSATDFEKTVTSVVDKTREAVVSVSNYQHPTQNMNGLFPFSDGGSGQSEYSQGGLDLDEFNQEPVLYGTGSGVVYKIEGDKAYVVTNNHVVAGADSLEITMANGDTTEADLVGTDVYSDLAVLTIPKDKASQVMEFANSDDVKVGNIAIAIGSPIDSEFASSVTQGIVSGLNRSLPVDTDEDGQEDWEMTLLQTDAAINPGNSGGALVNSQGKLIGINSSKLAQEAIEGMGFAIPVNDVKNITDQLEENGKVIRPQLGVSMYDLNQISLKSRQEILKLKDDQTDGVIVVEVAKGSSAEAAGLQQYDVITGVDDTPVTDSQSLKQALYQHKVGETVTIKYLREGKESSAQINLQAPEEAPQATEIPNDNQ